MQQYVVQIERGYRRISVNVTGRQDKNVPTAYRKAPLVDEVPPFSSHNDVHFIKIMDMKVGSVICFVKCTGHYLGMLVKEAAIFPPPYTGDWGEGWEVSLCEHTILVLTLSCKPSGSSFADALIDTSILLDELSVQSPECISRYIVPDKPM